MKWLVSIRTKLFALVFLASFALISIIYWQIGNTAEKVANSVIDRSLTQSRKILDTRIESRFRFIKELSTGIARDVRILPLVAEEQSLTLQDLSVEYETVYDFDVLFFISEKGTIIARADNPDAIGVNLAGKSDLFDNALQGIESTGFIVSQGKLMQTVVTPIFDNIARDVVQGAVVLSYELSPDTAKEIVALTESKIGFFVFSRDENRVISGVAKSYMTDDELSDQVTDYFSSHNEAWELILDSESNDYRANFEIDGQIYHSVLRRINGAGGNPLGFVISMRSEADLKQPFKEIQTQLLVTGGIALLVASLFAGLMAMGISRPIIRLVDLIKLIQSGMYPQDSEKTDSKDEVGILKNALIRMGQSLREKAELEAYLAELAEEVDFDSTIDIVAEADQGVEPIARDALTQITDANEDPDKTVLKVADKPVRKSDTLSATRVIDRRYEVISTLGSGAMGSVYLTRDIDLDEKIAIKVMKKSFLKNLEGLNFKEEIRLARQITHRNIVRTFDFGAWSEYFYITMEYVPGYDLGRLIGKKGKLDINIGKAICKQVCSAMIAAHQMGIIHRDLKPQNMIINRQGILKIMDFGLAMRVNKQDQNSKHSGSQQEQKYTMGTPRYMAPEQFTGQDLDERTDIYAIGIIMFTIFHGEPPYSDPDFMSLARKHRSDPIPEIIGKDGPLPPRLVSVIHKAMAKEPENRFQSVKAMFDEINNI